MLATLVAVKPYPVSRLDLFHRCGAPQPRFPESDLGDARLGFGARPLPSMWRAEVPYRVLMPKPRTDHRGVLSTPD